VPSIQQTGRPDDRVESVTDKPDLFTTAGKIADLRARYTEAVVDAEAKAKEKQHAKAR
jgi:propionyl-CoA carboxylase beta chain